MCVYIYIYTHIKYDHSAYSYIVIAESNGLKNAGSTLPCYVFVTRLFCLSIVACLFLWLIIVVVLGSTLPDLCLIAVHVFIVHVCFCLRIMTSLCMFMIMYVCFCSYCSGMCYDWSFMCIYIYIYTHVYIYIYIYIHVCVYIHIYIYICFCLGVTSLGSSSRKPAYLACSCR